MSLKDFRKEASTDGNNEIRGELHDRYTWLENHCNDKNHLSKLSQEYDLHLEGGTDLLDRLKKLIPIKSNDFNFKVRPIIQSASNYLKGNENHGYKGNKSFAILQIIKEIRDNLTHHGKHEIDSQQYKRNMELVYIANEYLSILIDLIENEDTKS